LPSWDIHEKWARKMGLSGETVSWVNRFIDDQKHHDVGRGKSKAIQDIVKNFARIYGGGEAVLALELHHVLDFICSRMDPRRIVKEETFAIIAQETRGFPLQQRMEIMRELRGVMREASKTVARVPRNIIINDLNNFMERQEISDKVKCFVIENLHEILEDLSTYCGGEDSAS